LAVVVFVDAIGGDTQIGDRRAGWRIAHFWIAPQIANDRQMLVHFASLLLDEAARRVSLL
jgi:hypothetical protein